MGTISLQIPVTGQPNSTEDPKIASDFTTVQTVINGNIDTNNISSTAGITATQLAASAQFGGSVQLTFAAPARASRNAALTVGGGWSKINVDLAQFNPGGNMNVTTTYRYNVPTAGYYQVNGNVTGISGATIGLMSIGVYQNGVQVSQGDEVQLVNASYAYGLSVNDIISCSANDYLELFTYNGTSSVVPISTGNPIATYLAVSRVA